MTFLIGAILFLTTPAAPARQLLVSSVVRAYGDDDVDGLAVLRGPVALPDNIAVATAYQDVVEDMLRRSPTFRAQCARIGAARSQLRVVVRRSLLAPRQAAVTHVTRQGGRVEAEVEVSPFGDQPRLIAHEFEHVIEQLDDVDLAAMADRPGTGVRSDPNSGFFETERAIAIGKRVEWELSRVTARR
jgi:hypothetical protein